MRLKKSPDDLEVLRMLNVSRETVKLLHEYVAMLKKWNKSINLISRKSLNNVWDRHILDCAQLGVFLPRGKKIWLDLGSGGGFPGIVIAILAKSKFPDLEIILVEADKRKSVFLGEVIRKLELNATVLAKRIEDCPVLSADIVSARALAPIKKLLFYFDFHGQLGSKGLFLKGKNYTTELKEVIDLGTFNIEINTSLTDKLGVIIEVDKRRNC